MKYIQILILIFTNFLLFCYTSSKKHNPFNFLVCNKMNCPVTQGICTKDNKCSCYDGYKTVNDIKYGLYQCNYQKKSQALAFILEFLIGFGVGHMYLGNIKIGTIKLTFCFLCAFFICFYPYFTIRTRSKTLRNTVPYFQSIFGIIYVFWQAMDGVLIGLSYYTDGNGIELNEW
jgi:hypothetical protein